MTAPRAEQRRWVHCSVEVPAVGSAVMIETMQQMGSDYLFFCFFNVPVFVDAMTEGNETMHRCDA